MRRRMLLDIHKSILPLSYEECEYLESSGTQYISILNNNYYYSNLKIEFTYDGEDTYIFGGGHDNENNFTSHNLFYLIIQDGVLHFKHDRGGHAYLGPAVSGLKQGDNVVNIDTINYEINCNGKLTSIKDYYNRNISTIRSSILFGFVNTTTGVRYLYKGKIYYFKCDYETSTPWYLIPALRKSDNKPGMYDIVRKVFVTNKGTGEFGYKIKRTGKVVSPK